MQSLICCKHAKVSHKQQQTTFTIFLGIVQYPYKLSAFTTVHSIFLAVGSDRLFFYNLYKFSLAYPTSSTS